MNDDVNAIDHGVLVVVEMLRARNVKPSAIHHAQLWIRDRHRTGHPVSPRVIEHLASWALESGHRHGLLPALWAAGWAPPVTPYMFVSDAMYIKGAKECMRTQRWEAAAHLLLFPEQPPLRMWASCVDHMRTLRHVPSSAMVYAALVMAGRQLRHDPECRWLLQLHECRAPIWTTMQTLPPPLQRTLINVNRTIWEGWWRTGMVPHPDAWSLGWQLRWLQYHTEFSAWPENIRDRPPWRTAVLWERVRHPDAWRAWWMADGPGGIVARLNMCNRPWWHLVLNRAGWNPQRRLAWWTALHDAAVAYQKSQPGTTLPLLSHLRSASRSWCRLVRSGDELIQLWTLVVGGTLPRNTPITGTTRWPPLQWQQWVRGMVKGARVHKLRKLYALCKAQPTWMQHVPEDLVRHVSSFITGDFWDAHLVQTECTGPKWPWACPPAFQGLSGGPTGRSPKVDSAPAGTHSGCATGGWPCQPRCVH